MAKTKFEMNYFGVRKLLRSKNTMKVCEAVAEEVADRAGEGYEVTRKYTAPTRVVVEVAPVTEEAMQDNFDNNTLLKALNK